MASSDHPARIYAEAGRQNLQKTSLSLRFPADASYLEINGFAVSQPGCSKSAGRCLLVVSASCSAWAQLLLEMPEVMDKASVSESEIPGSSPGGRDLGESCEVPVKQASARLQARLQTQSPRTSMVFLCEGPLNHSLTTFPYNPVKGTRPCSILHVALPL